MRRLLVPLALAALLAAPAAAMAAPQAPLVDIVEIAGIIDRPIARYAMERIEEAERGDTSLLVFSINSLGGLKVSDGQLLPPLVRRIRDARVPIAVWVGPRSARAAGMTVYMAAAAHVAAMTPSATMGPGVPLDHGEEPPASTEPFGEAFEELATARGRTVRAERRDVYDSEAALRAGFVDHVVPDVATLLRRIDGDTITTASGAVTLSIPDEQSTVRFFQPGPVRRFMHAFANPALVYLCFIAAVLLLVFELFQPGFGVAGGTAALLFAGAGYGMTVLPVRSEGLIVLCIGVALLTADVYRDEIFVPTFAGFGGLLVGSILLLPGGSDAVRLSPWLIGITAAACLIFFVPVMTVVRRARKPIAPETRARLVGGLGRVRSVLNPEGFVWVEDELWRARSEDGTRIRVGEAVVVSSVDGAVLVVRHGAPAVGGVLAPENP